LYISVSTVSRGHLSLVSLVETNQSERDLEQTVTDRSIEGKEERNIIGVGGEGINFLLPEKEQAWHTH
jgi:hypothetical protein